MQEGWGRVARGNEPNWGCAEEGAKLLAERRARMILRLHSVQDFRLRDLNMMNHVGDRFQGCFVGLREDCI